MKRIAFVALLCMSSPVFAAFQNFTVQNRIPVISIDETGQRGSTAYEIRPQPYCFRVDVVSDSEGYKAETFRDGRPFVTASLEDRFSVRLYNPLPVRVAVNLSIDGINSITGKPSGPSDGDKWIIEPYSFIVIRGWQVNQGEARRFFFTSKHKSYAKWTGDRTGKDLSVNCGVIGAAYFWSQKELNQYYEQHPEYRYVERQGFNWPYLKSMRKAYSGAVLQNSVGDGRAQLAEPMDQLAAAKGMPQRAGTGMGERESNPTVQVDFPYDSGMYTVAQSVVIYYDFSTPEPLPNPFPALSYAPEMP